MYNGLFREVGGSELLVMGVLDRCLLVGEFRWRS